MSTLNGTKRIKIETVTNDIMAINTGDDQAPVGNRRIEEELMVMNGKFGEYIKSAMFRMINGKTLMISFFQISFATNCKIFEKITPHCAVTSARSLICTQKQMFYLEN